MNDNQLYEAMWHKKYKDYPPDEPLVREQVTTGKGIVGCEMHDLNGWGNSLHIFRKGKKIGLLAKLINFLLGRKVER